MIDNAQKLLGIGLTLLVLAAVPLALIAVHRAQPSPLTRLDPVPDMDKQPKFKPQQVGNPMFADQRAMRPVVPGTVAREDLQVGLPRDQASYDAHCRAWKSMPTARPRSSRQIPVPVSMDLMRRGQERFNIYCAAVPRPERLRRRHGGPPGGRNAGHRRGRAAGWVAPTNYHTDEIRGRPVGHLYNTIANGIRTMPAYGKQISVLDRWAIVAYVKALQRSQHAKPEDVPQTNAELQK